MNNNQSSRLLWLNLAKQVAPKYNMQINWKNLDLEHGLIEFIGDYTNEQRDAFWKEMNNVFNNCENETIN